MTHMPDMPDDRAISLMAIDQYFRSLHWTDQLSEEEETKYLERVLRGIAERSKPAPNQWVLNLARDARDHLVERYQPMVVHAARRFFRRSSHLELLDLIQEGNIGLLSAFDTFTSEKGYSFPVYASFQIHDAIADTLRVQESPCGSSVHTSELFSKFRRFKSRFFDEHGYVPDSEEIAKGLEISLTKAHDLLQGRTFQKASSLQEAMIYKDGHEGKEAFSSLYASSVKQEDERQKHLKTIFDRVMDTLLTPHQQEAVRLRFDLFEDRPSVETYEELAQTIGVSSVMTAVSRCGNGVDRLRKLLVLTEDHLPFCELLEPDYYTTTQAASLLGVTKQTILRYIGTGLLPATLGTVPLIEGEIYKLSKEPVEALLAERKKGQVAEVEMSSYYTLAQAASLLEVSVQTVFRAASTGRLPGKKVNGKTVQKWIVEKQAVHALMAERQLSEVA